MSLAALSLGLVLASSGFRVDTLVPDEGYVGGCFIGLQRADSWFDDGYIFVDDTLSQGDIRIDGGYVRLSLFAGDNGDSDIHRFFHSDDRQTVVEENLKVTNSSTDTDGWVTEVVTGRLTVTHKGRTMTLRVKGSRSC
ncbi:hypothetical protein ABI_25700 [Asticcacaulis biprosthecium C19]|uniref:Uncharacterized protein n=1 Tax=Asticcacaulis biprosthecium C19 TaxID=715226 RepID=F4QP98_9CAUL|nr:hypothetical protein [Asticcacaulis biprosthecium]EGF91156.1 hypothetical protein ABI_25700 [Asticcacaulis biprosthecium C19]